VALQYHVFLFPRFYSSFAAFSTSLPGIIAFGGIATPAARNVLPASPYTLLKKGLDKRMRSSIMEEVFISILLFSPQSLALHAFFLAAS
jgi:hypothetical protein